MGEIIDLQEFRDNLFAENDIVADCLSLDTDNINEKEILCKIC